MTKILEENKLLAQIVNALSPRFTNL